MLEEASLSEFERRQVPKLVVTYAVRGHADHSRLVARVVFEAPGGWLGDTLIGPPLALGDLMMMRKQLMTLKTLAEQPARPLARS